MVKSVQLFYLHCCFITMSRYTPIRSILFLFIFLCGYRGSAQLVVREEVNAQTLAQELVGKGVIISNATLTQSTTIIPSGFFKNMGGTNIGIDSGILLTSGRVKSNPRNGDLGINGNGLSAA